MVQINLGKFDSVLFVKVEAHKQTLLGQQITNSVLPLLSVYTDTNLILQKHEYFDILEFSHQ